MKQNIVVVLLSVILSSLICLVIINWQVPQKQAFIENLKLFENFKGKKELEAKLLNIKSSNKLRLDSLRMIITNEESELYYRQQLLVVEQQEETLSAEYNAQIWNQLNSYIKEFGKKNGYDFIYGATGNGSMMYARETMDITDQLIDYANKTYEGN